MLTMGVAPSSMPTKLAACGETPAAFGRRCIPSGCVAPRSNTPGILARRALPAGRIAALGATLDFHHRLLALLAVVVLGTAPPARAQVTLTPAPEQITVDINGKPF